MAKQPVKTQLSREEMEAVIKGGGSVSLAGGEIINSLADLPDDEESIAQAEAELEERKAKASASSKTDSKKSGK